MTEPRTKTYQSPSLPPGTLAIIVRPGEELPQGLYVNAWKLNQGVKDTIQIVYKPS